MLEKESYLHIIEDKVYLMSKHSYYYQVKQLLVTGFKFCDFFFGLKKTLSWKLFALSQKFKQIFRAKQSLYFALFFYQSLLANFLQAQLRVKSQKTNGIYVKCKMNKNEDIITCERSKTYKVQWFHIKCMTIKKVLKGKFYSILFL